MSTHLYLLASVALTAVIAPGQTASEIIEKVAQNYRSLKSYQFEWQVTTESVNDGNESRMRSTLKLAMKPPDLRREEVAGGANPSVRVYDGSTVWELRSRFNEFARQEQATYKPRMMFMFHDPVQAAQTLDKVASGAKLVREETIDAIGGQRPCWVIETPPRPLNRMVVERSPTTYWIDKAKYLVLKETETTKMQVKGIGTPAQTVTRVCTLARVNEPLPDGLFRFEPPKGAVVVADFPQPFGGGTPIANRPSPDWMLTDLDGKEVTGSSLRGKPVLIDFWTTWCAGCPAQMEKVKEAERAVEGKGLVVLAINKAEPAELVKKYGAEHGYKVRILLDLDGKVSEKFSVSGLPSVILIDRNGQIRAHFRGYSSDVNLVDELKKIGLD